MKGALVVLFVALLLATGALSFGALAWDGKAPMVMGYAHYIGGNYSAPGPVIDLVANAKKANNTIAFNLSNETLSRPILKQLIPAVEESSSAVENYIRDSRMGEGSFTHSMS